MSFVTHDQNELVWFTAPLLDGVRHGFSTRRGGVSPAPWDTLDLRFGCGDAPENVAENYRRLLGAVGGGAGAGRPLPAGPPGRCAAL